MILDVMYVLGFSFHMELSYIPVFFWGFFFFWWLFLGFELRTLLLLGRCSTT
jgi:hypothetical protein